MERVRLEDRAHLLSGSLELDVALSENLRLAARRVEQRDEHAQRRRLPGAVRTEESGDATGLRIEREVVDGEDAAVAFGQVPDLDHSLRVWRASSEAA